MGKGNQSNKTDTTTEEVKNESTSTDLGSSEDVSGGAGSGSDGTGGAADTSSQATGDAASGTTIDVAAGAPAAGVDGTQGNVGTDQSVGADSGADPAAGAGASENTSQDQAKDPVVDPAVVAAPAPAPAPVEVAAAPVVETPAPAASPAAFAAAVSDTINKEAAASGIVVKDVEAEAAAAPFYEGKGLANNSVSWLRRLEEYIAAMDPKKPMNPETGVPHQKTLFRVLTWIINSSPDADFQTLLGIVLQQFNKHSAGVFHETAVNRFPEHLTLNQDERSTFFQLLNLLNIGADVKGREQRLKQLDFNRMFTKIPLDQITEQGRQRILAYFGK